MANFSLDRKSAICEHAVMITISTYLATAKVSQAELARQAKISRSYLSELVSGAKVPSLKVALAIERATRGKVKAASWLEGGK